MQQPISVSQISHALFEADPMHTCCAENQCFGEYDRVASSASKHLQNGYSLSQALFKALQEWFGAELAEGRDLGLVCEQLNPLMPQDHSDNSAETWDKIDGHRYREYHLIFADSGSLKVRVKFDQENAWIPTKRMQPGDINQLIHPETGDFLTRMAFDGHLYEVTKIDISLARKTVTIHARQPKI
jgi:hypothetical protein